MTLKMMFLIFSGLLTLSSVLLTVLTTTHAEQEHVITIITTNTTTIIITIVTITTRLYSLFTIWKFSHLVGFSLSFSSEFGQQVVLFSSLML